MNAVDWHTRIASDFDRRYTHDPSFVERRAVWTRAIERHVKAGDHAYDLGCGSGVFTFELAKRAAHVTGLDASAEMIRLCEAKRATLGVTNVQFVVGDMRDLRATAADVITCSSVLEYLPSLDEAFATLRALLVPRGTLLMSLPNATSAYRRVEPIAHRLTGRPRYYKFVRHVVSADAATRKLARHGFSIDTVEYYGRTPLLSSVLPPKYAANLMLIVAKT